MTAMNYVCQTMDYIVTEMKITEKNHYAYGILIESSRYPNEQLTTIKALRYRDLKERVCWPSLPQRV